MKKLLLLASALMFTACSNDTATQMILPVEQNQTNVSSANSSNDNPMFAEKMKLGKKYNVRTAMKLNNKNSICGPNDLQEVNSYDGSLGQTKEFVKEFQGSVGAMEDTGKDSSSKFCSGTLIGKDLFLTASHCVEGSNATSKYVAFNYEKAKGSSTVLPQTHYKVAEVIEEGGSYKIDYAILRLEGNPGEKFGFKKLATEPEKNSPLTIIQHPSGETKQVEAGTRGLTNSGVYMGYGDIDTEPGSSGSGVLDDKGSVVGVHTNGGCGMSGGENKAVKMSEILKVSKTVQALMARK